ncbi:DUF1697 domain-containing protein [Nocardia sp. NPDC051030]|uniref:DUF1697 domain-containing protein n=1 Tax=Nocardia sp. NPDC051030 TaxID=3155162 RepID=UPI0034488F39
MHSYAAFLRGIMPANPNMRNEKLRAVFEGLGFDKVSPLLSSGNVVFSTAESDTAALESQIQEALNAELGIPGGTLVRSREQLQALVDSDPFPGLTHCRETYLIVTFTKKHLAKLIEPPADTIGSTVKVVGYDKKAGALLSIIDNSDPSTTAFMGWIEKAYGKDVTTRTFLTVQKALKKLDA